MRSFQNLQTLLNTKRKKNLIDFCCLFFFALVQTGSLRNRRKRSIEKKIIFFLQEQQQQQQQKEYKSAYRTRIFKHITNEKWSNSISYHVFFNSLRLLPLSLSLSLSIARLTSQTSSFYL